GEIGAPRRLARSAVREGAEHARAGRIGVRAHQLVAARRTRDFHGRERGDASREARARVARPGAGLAPQLQDRHAMGRLHELHRVRVPIHPRLARLGLHADAAVALPGELTAEVLIVHADDAAGGAATDQREILHGVAVAAELAGLRIDGLRRQPVGVRHALRIEIGRAGYEAV